MTPIDAPQCSACDNKMDLTVLIPSFGSPYGLKVYYLPKMRALSRLSRFAAIQGSIASPCRADQ